MIEIIKNAYALTRKNALILIGAVLLIMVISIVFSFITAAFEKVPVLSFISSIASTVLQLYLSVGFLRLVLCIIDNKEPEFSDIKPGFLEILKYFSASILIAIVFLVLFLITILIMGSIGVFNINISSMLSDVILNKENLTKYSSSELLYGVSVFFVMAIPAILVYMRLQFAAYMVIDKPEETAFSAVLRSFNITKGYLFYIILTLLSIVLLNILGILTFLVGLLFTMPMSAIMLVLLYRSLEQNYEADQIETIE
jgi:Protein of unknown function (DUF975)